MAKALEVGEYREVDYMLRDITPESKATVVAEVNAKLADGWRIIHTTTREVPPVAIVIFHVFVR